MTAHQSPFVSDFLTGDSAHTYREAVALAAEQASVTLGGATAPGLVDGYSALKRDAERLDLDDPDGVGLSRALDEATGLLAEKSVVVTHPAYLAHLHCPPALPSLAAEVLISAFNQSMDSFDQAPAATAIEQQVVEYLCARMGYGPEADGTFTSGGTQSNLQALLLARDLFARKSGWDIAGRGLPPESGAWRVLCTRQTHFSVQQAPGCSDWAPPPSSRYPPMMPGGCGPRRSPESCGTPIMRAHRCSRWCSPPGQRISERLTRSRKPPRLPGHTVSGYTWMPARVAA